MKTFNTIILSVAFILATSAVSYAQSDHANKKIKTYINNMVQKVETAEEPGQKRAILNKSFDKMIEAFDRVESMSRIPEKDKEGIALLKTSILEKQQELNGDKGFKRVADRQLDSFANYVQQDMEQANTITISVTTLLLIIIILLLI
ncbi:hypothetical protein SAMN05443144_12062 [Fodinibius roseus]|uniref:Uncharacterized protein n=1 Tax=Fodinibius roseus TaxID=1194090 RepID=A0A1M5HJI5_9BACT|nr:hypothetical protein [Fodinibius roseus]SHG16139.1 hypothetical protein SAMN05443144_12062 [Fodinibius roseus]